MAIDDAKSVRKWRRRNQSEERQMVLQILKKLANKLLLTLFVQHQNYLAATRRTFQVQMVCTECTHILVSHNA